MGSPSSEMVKNLEYGALVEITVVVHAQVEVHGGNLESSPKNFVAMNT